MQRDPYDGKPYFCTTCGEFMNPADCSGGECVPESKRAALLRLARRRAPSSDLASFKKAGEDAA